MTNQDSDTTESKLNSSSRFWRLFGLFFGLIGIAVGIYSGISTMGAGKAKAPLHTGFDANFPILILATERAEKSYAEGITTACKLHPEAERSRFYPDKPSRSIASITGPVPKYAMIFIMPDELDVNVAWSWLAACSQIDEDPFVDLRTGFITGENPARVASFMNRTSEFCFAQKALTGKMIDNLGANTEVEAAAFVKSPLSFMIPVYSERLGVETISHGCRGFTKDRLDSMTGAGILHFGGHGYPDRIVDSLNGVYVRKLKLDPAVVFSGACYTGVTGRWYDVTTGKLIEKFVDPEVCFSLGMLANESIAYLAALHPDHGIPVYQEMEYMAYAGASLGDVIKHSYDSTVIANGGSLPILHPLVSGAKIDWSPSEIMMKGTVSRVLFGDPTLIPVASFCPGPFDIETTVQAGGDSILAKATLRNSLLKASFTNTFHNELSGVNAFNDRIYCTFELPPDWDNVTDVSILRITSEGKELKGVVRGFALENDFGKRIVHLHVDVGSTGYMAGPARSKGSVLEFSVRRKP